MKELMLDRKEAALALLKEVAALPRVGAWGGIPENLRLRIELVLNLPDKPGEEACKET